MKINVFTNKVALGQAAADDAAALIRDALQTRGRARILVATGGSQFEFLESLTAHQEIDWPKVEMFHLDEYVGLPINHPASFRKYLLERFIGRTGVTRYHLLDGETNAEAVCRDIGRLLQQETVDVAFAGIGENGHLAFNDPPADFETEQPYRVVALDEACRQQQVGEGWFKTLDEVPMRAISISVRQLMRARAIISVVPDARKALAVQRCLAGPVTPLAPASMLQHHPAVSVYLDPESAALLQPGIAQPSASRS